MGFCLTAKLGWNACPWLPAPINLACLSVGKDLEAEKAVHYLQRYGGGLLEF